MCSKLSNYSKAEGKNPIVLVIFLCLVLIIWIV